MRSHILFFLVPLGLIAGVCSWPSSWAAIAFSHKSGRQVGLGEIILAQG